MPVSPTESVRKSASPDARTDAAVRAVQKKSGQAASADSAERLGAVARRLAANRPSRIDKLIEIELGSLVLDVHGQSALQSIQIPADAIGVLVSIEGPEDGYYMVDQLSGPHGKALVCDGTAKKGPGPFDSPNRSVSGMVAGTGSLLVPNSTQAALCAGKWTLRVAGKDDQGHPAKGPVRVRVIIKTAPRTPRSGRLDLHLHFTGARGLTAATARCSRDFKDAVAGLGKILGKANIKIGNISYDDVSPRFQKQIVGGADSKIARMFKSSTDGEGVNLFFVKELTLSGQDPRCAGPSGFSGGMPGATNPGGNASGIAICMANMDPGRVMTHEIGHFLGLFHLQEQFIAADDPIDDTKNPGWGNLMNADEGSGGPNLTPGQIRVLFAHPLVQIVG